MNETGIIYSLALFVGAVFGCVLTLILYTVARNHERGTEIIKENLCDDCKQEYIKLREMYRL